MLGAYKVAEYIGSFQFLDQSFAETKTKTKRLKFGLSPELRLTNRRSAKSLATR